MYCAQTAVHIRFGILGLVGTSAPNMKSVDEYGLKRGTNRAGSSPAFSMRSCMVLRNRLHFHGSFDVYVDNRGTVCVEYVVTHSCISDT